MAALISKHYFRETNTNMPDLFFPWNYCLTRDDLNYFKLFIISFLPHVILEHLALTHYVPLI